VLVRGQDVLANLTQVQRQNFGGVVTYNGRVGQVFNLEGSRIGEVEEQQQLQYVGSLQDIANNMQMEVGTAVANLSVRVTSMNSGLPVPLEVVDLGVCCTAHTMARTPWLGC